MHVAVLLYATGKILEHTKLKNDFWDGLVMFMKNEMIPRYQKLLSGHFEEDGKQTLTAEAQADEFLHEIQQLLKKVAENPEQAAEFFREDAKTKGCECGDAFAVSLLKAVPFASLTKTPACSQRSWLPGKDDASWALVEYMCPRKLQQTPPIIQRNTPASI